MRKLLLPIMALLALGACQTSGSIDSGGRGSHAILVVAEDADAGSVSRNSSVSRRVLNRISMQIRAYGFDVFDGAALVDNRLRGVADRRGDAEIVDLVRSGGRPPMDTIALFTVFTESGTQPHVKKLRVRVAGRLIGVRSGHRLGSFEAIDERDIHPHCTGPCYRETVGEIAGVLGREVADVLGRKLDVRFSGGAQWRDIDTSARGLTLSFHNFSVVEMLDIEENLQMFSGYRSHRPIIRAHRHAELWYETSIPHGKLQRNLNRMFDEMGVNARIAYRGDTYRIAQVTIPERARNRAPGYRW